MFFPVFGIVIWGIIDAASRPAWAWERAGQNKTLWIILQVVGLVVFGCVGHVVAIIYLVAIRPQLVQAQ
ncbi:MAG TPA: DUF2516 family protein, partial [Acidimicrobiales bacterium]